MKVEIWSDVVCPWCFVGKRRLEAALADFEHGEQVEVVYRSFQLDPSAPQHGHELTTPMLARKYGRSEAEMRQMQQQLTDLAAEEDLAFRLQETLHTRTIDAHRLLHLALAEGGTLGVEAADPPEPGPAASLAQSNCVHSRGTSPKIARLLPCGETSKPLTSRL